MGITVHLPSTPLEPDPAVHHPQGVAILIRSGHLLVQEDAYAEESAYTIAAYAPGMWTNVRKEQAQGQRRLT